MTIPNTHIQLDRREPWVQEMLAHFRPGATTPLPEPVRAFFVCPHQKILYAPIAKSACTSIKHLMMELGDLPQREQILRLGIHRATDGFITGAQLKDHRVEVAREALASPDYFRFSVVRDPVNRVISAYTEKFLVNRESAANLYHTADVVRAVRGESSPDFFAGISFREFVQYLVSSDPEELDTHWAPQHGLLAGPANYSDIFAMEDLGRLMQCLEQHLGRTIELGKHNVSLSGATDAPQPNGRCADTLPAALADQAARLSPEDFMSPDLVMQLKEYYAQDLLLHRDALAGQCRYREKALPLEPAAHISPRPLRQAAHLSRSVTLYSKGFYSLNDNGHGEVGVMISNTSNAPLDFSRIEQCYLTYTARDRDGNILHHDAYGIVNPGLVPPQGSTHTKLELHLPSALRDQVVAFTIAMRLGETFFVEDLSPVHVTSVRHLQG